MKEAAPAVSARARSGTWGPLSGRDKSLDASTDRTVAPDIGRAYLPALDGLRGIAILLVLVYHCSELLDLKNSANPVDWFGWRVFQLGWIGVDLFFVLSGFLITGILLESKSQPFYFRTFYARRSLRIFPLYYLVVFFTFAVFPLVSSFIGERSADAAAALGQLPSIEGKQWWYLLYASNFLAALEGDMGHRLLAVTWSLAIEEQFYLVWPLVVFLFRARTVLIISLITVAVAFLCRCGLVWAMREGVWDGNRTAVYVWPFCRMDALAIGAIISVLWRQPGMIPILQKWAKRGLILGAPMFLLAILSGRFGNRDGVVQTFGYSMLALFFGALLVQVLLLRQTGRMFRAATHPGLLQVGKFAYAIYLFHLPLMFGMDALWFGRILDFKIAGSYLPALILFSALVAVLVFLAAKCSWVLIERPFLRLKRFFPSASDRVSVQRET